MNNGMRLLTPANDWREGLPCGDGSLCALVYGGITPETILFNHDQLWYGGKVASLPDLSSEAKLVREMGFAGDLKGANDHMSRILTEKGFQGLVPIFHPALDLKIKTGQHTAFKKYQRTLDFSTGETVIKWQQNDVVYERKFFISRYHHIGVLKFNSSEGLLDTAFQLCEHNLSDSFAMDGAPRNPPLQYETHGKGDKLYINIKGSDGGQYGAVIKVIAEGGGLEIYDDNTWTEQTSALPILWGLPLEHRTSMRVSEAQSVTAVIAFYVNKQNIEDEQQSLSDQLDNLDCDYETLFDHHKKIHSELFNRLQFEIDDMEYNDPDESNDILLLRAYQGIAPSQLLVKMFYYGRYLLICCSNENGLPPTLQGTFNGDYFPAWNSFYVHNENTQMYYWQALSGGMPEVAGAMFKYFEKFISDYQINAKNLFGCGGIFIPLVAAANTGLLQDPQPHVINFTGCAAWISAHFYDYYLYTGDVDFLKNHAIPFMEQAALFYEDYLIDDKDGKYTIFPSNSPENSPRNSFDGNIDLTAVMNPGIPTTFDSTIDTALAKELFKNLCESYSLLGIKEEKQRDYKKIIAKIRPYRINEDGALAEWIYPGHSDNYAHRHVSHIYPLFPGMEITEESEKNLFDAVKIAVDKRIQVGLASQTGWSLAHLSNIYARLHDSEKALDCLDTLTRTCVGRNLFTYHNDYRNMGVTLKIILGKSAPFQIDANMGLTSAVIEMLMSSDSNTIRIAPALPRRWQKGRIGTLSTRCNCGIDITWDHTSNSISAIIKAKNNRTIRIILPKGYVFNGLNDFNLTMEKNHEYKVDAVNNK